MSLRNLALNIQAASWSSQYASVTYSARYNLTNGIFHGPYGVYASAYGQTDNQWAIFDLGAIYTVDSIKLHGCTDSDKYASVGNYRIGLSTIGMNDIPGFYTDFSIVVSSFVPLPSGSYQDYGTNPFDYKTLLPGTQARYIKIYFDNNWGSSELITAAEFEIFNHNIGNFTSDITSTSVILRNTSTIASTSVITANYTSTVNTTSHIKDRYTSTIASTSKSVHRDTVSIRSYSRVAGSATTTIASSSVIRYQSSLQSNSRILRHDVSTITSSSKILRYTYTGIVSSIHIGRGWVGPLESPSFYTIPVYARADLKTTSGETIVNDMITGDPLSGISGDIVSASVLDLVSANTPHGYVNYDWAYDWVVKTYNNSQYLFEARQSNSLIDLASQPYNVIQQGQIIPRGSVNRYHQWRLHLWASGSGDFELHQFTIKAYVQYPADPFSRAIAMQLPSTTAPIVLEGSAPIPENSSLYVPPKGGKDKLSADPIIKGGDV